MKRPYAKIAVVLFLSIISLTSCFDQKKIAYFQKDASHPDTLSAVAKAYVPRIQAGDILNIYVNSLSPQASIFFNPYIPAAAASTDASGSGGSGSGSGSSTGGVTTSPSLTQTASPGFLVDPAGNIELPLVGKIKISDLTTVEAADTIKLLLKKYLIEPTVTVRFLNYKISVIGEVAHPSVYVIPNERITLPEALSMAGDLTIFARRDNIQVIRDVDGKKVFGTINLNSREVFNSPFYYLHANDMVYVEPGKSKAAATDRTYILIPSFVSLITALIILFKK